MGTPTEEELNQALKCAAEMREQGEDPDFIAKSLLNVNYRLKQADHVIDAIKHYMKSGHATREHSKLIRALDDYSGVARRTPERSSFGLD